RRVAAGLLLVFLIQVYINAANEVWWSGGSFGNRRLTDYSIVIAWGLLFLAAHPRPSLRYGTVALVVLCSAWSFTLLLAERRLILPLDRYIPFYHDQFLPSLGRVDPRPIATAQATTPSLTPGTSPPRASTSAILFLATLGIFTMLCRRGKVSLQRVALYTLSSITAILFAISTLAAYRTPPLQQNEIPATLPSSSTILWDNYLELAGYHIVKQNYPQAIATADKAIAILPGEPGGYWYRAIAHL